MADLQTVYPRIEDALDVIESELCVIDAEAEAFASFRRRLHRLEPAATASVGVGGSLVASSSSAGIDPASVRAAYRETVMAMDHYERDYGESLIENVDVEFGSTVRQLLAGDVPISPMQRGVIDSAAERALDERTQFKRALVGERDSLETVEARLGDVERRLHDVRDVPLNDPGRQSTLRELASTCQELAADRQRSVHQGPAPKIAGIGEKTLTTFLYEDQDYQFPALVEITDVAERIDDALAK